MSSSEFPLFVKKLPEADLPFEGEEPIRKYGMVAREAPGKQDKATDRSKAGMPFKRGQHSHAKPAARALRDGAASAPGIVSSLIR